MYLFTFLIFQIIIIFSLILFIENSYRIIRNIVLKSLIVKDYDLIAKILFYLNSNNKDYYFSHKEDGEWLVFEHTTNFHSKKVKLSNDLKSLTYKF